MLIAIELIAENLPQNGDQTNLYRYDGEESTMKKDKSSKKHSKEEKAEHKREKERSHSCSDLSCCDVTDSCGCYYDPCGNSYISACCC
jgi:hypothetical protein